VGSLTLQTDSNTFFAVIFKALAPLLGEPFQYFGIWLFLCFYLQGLFAFRILRKFDFSFWEAFWGSTFFMWAPVLVGRIGHLSLCGHWMVLAIFDLYFSKDRSWKTFLGVVLVTSAAALVHPYLFVMVFGLACAFFVSEIKKFGCFRVFVQFFGFIAFSALVCWLGGYFEKNDPTTDLNFGGYSADLLTFFNPAFQPNKFSIFLPRLRMAGGQQEGFGFFGCGRYCYAFVFDFLLA
jgi:hypothetical protein